VVGQQNTDIADTLQLKPLTHEPSQRPIMTGSQDRRGFLAAVVTAVNRLRSMPRILIITSLKLLSAANIFRKKIRAAKKSKMLVLLSLTCNIMAAEQRRRNRSCWTHEWIGRRPDLVIPPL